MPIREFKCLDCGTVSELLVDIGRNSDSVVCKSCGSEKMERMMSAPSLSTGNSQQSASFGGCCGSNPSKQGCTPGSCCGGNFT